MKKSDISDTGFMIEAIKEAKKSLLSSDVPIGAIIVKSDKIIGRGFNQVEKNNDPTAHAELIAIKKAIKKYGHKHLLDCTIYTTLEPCPMCAGAIVLSRIKRVVFSSEDSKAGASTSLYSITNDKRLNHRCIVNSGLLKDESALMLKYFFKELRLKNKKNKY